MKCVIGIPLFVSLFNPAIAGAGRCPGSISADRAEAIAEHAVGGSAVKVGRDDDVACAFEVVVLADRTIWEVKVSAKGQVISRERTGAIQQSSFVDEIDNRFLPTEPGTTFFYEGDREGVPTTNVTRVTAREKRIMGVECTVVHDQAFEDGVLAEDTFDYFAQDREGNVWYFGEDTRELDEDGNVISTEGTWRAGRDGARPGLISLAEPRIGDRYRQELAPGVAEDMAQVESLTGRRCVPAGCFDDLLVTREWTPLEPDVAERKYYAPDVGFISGKMIQGGEEFTELVQVLDGEDD